MRAFPLRIAILAKQSIAWLAFLAMLLMGSVERGHCARPFSSMDGMAGFGGTIRRG